MARHLSSLPARRTRLYGREAVTRSLVAQLTGAETRLVSVTGPGGSGKTSIAIEAARLAEPGFADGVAFVALEAVGDGAGVAHAVAATLGVLEANLSAADALVAFLSTRELLLVVDNCEHVVGEVGELADLLLDRCQGLRLLTTSRTSLRVRGEHVVALPPLAVPREPDTADMRALAEVPSVALFTERARAVNPSFGVDARSAAAVASICTRLDGLPLALELAAAQAGAFSAEEIAERLRDDQGFLGLATQVGAARQRTLEATFDWSYRLLEPDEATLLRRLAVFEGGWTLAAAEQVCAGGLTPASAVLAAFAVPPAAAASTASASPASAAPAPALPPPLAPLGAPVGALLGRLVDQSLVVRDAQPGGSRYRLLAPIGEIAAGRLAASGELPSVRAVHGAYYLALARTRRPDTAHADPADLARIAADEANCLGALRTFTQAGIVPAELAMTAALIEYWRVRGHLRVGLALLERAIRDADPAVIAPPLIPVRAFALLAASDLATLLGDLDQAEELLAQGEALVVAMQVPAGQATALAMHGNIAAARGDFDECRAWYERARAFMDTVPEVTQMFWLASIGGLELAAGRYDDAWLHLAEARRMMGTLPETWYHGRTLGHLGMVARARGDDALAKPLLIDGLRALVAYGARPDAIPVIESLAGIANDAGEARRAAVLFGAASVLRELTDVAHTATLGGAARRDLERVRKGLRLPVLAAAWARGRGMSLDDVCSYAASTDAGSTLRGYPGSALTTRERDVAALVAKGRSNQEIADELGMSVGTARIHVERILRKLGLGSRVQVATWVVEGGLDADANDIAGEQP